MGTSTHFLFLFSIRDFCSDTACVLSFPEQDFQESDLDTQYMTMMAPGVDTIFYNQPDSTHTRTFALSQSPSAVFLALTPSSATSRTVRTHIHAISCLLDYCITRCCFHSLSLTLSLALSLSLCTHAPQTCG